MTLPGIYPRYSPAALLAVGSFASRISLEQRDLPGATSAGLWLIARGTLVTAPIDVATLAPVVRQFIAQGGYVGSIVPPPATTILNAPQLATGKALGEAAATYIRTKLGGEARVVLRLSPSLWQ